MAWIGKDQKLWPRALELWVSLGRWKTSMKGPGGHPCVAKKMDWHIADLLFNRMIHIYIYICWFNRNFTSNCAEFSSRFLTTVDAYTPTERVFALLCLRVSGLSIRCFFGFYVLHEGCFKFVPSRVVFPYSILFTSLHVSAYPFYFVEVCVGCHIFIYVICLYLSDGYIVYIYIYLYMWKCHIRCFHCKVFSCRCLVPFVSAGCDAEGTQRPATGRHWGMAFQQRSVVAVFMTS